ncbi:MAG: hypothetical protein HFI37_07385 [Lachnospiraceae bacterium]|nr:hypothetical protein [Lachnospiraceae bacterium]
MKKRILSIILVCILLLSSEGMVYASEITAGKEVPEETQLNFSTTDIDTIAAPEKVIWDQVVLDGTQVSLQWIPVEEADGYILYRRTMSDTMWKELADIAVSDDDDEKGVAEFTDLVDFGQSESYSYQIQAYQIHQDSDGNEEYIYGEMSQEKTVTRQEEIQVFSQTQIKSQKPSAPVLTMTDCRYDYVNLSWKALELPKEDSGYYVYSLENGKTTILAEFARTEKGYTIYGYTNGERNAEPEGEIAESSSLAYSVKNVVHNRQYQFQVAAYVDKSSAEQIGEASNVITATPKLQAPQLKTVVEKAHNTAEITWQTTKDNPDGYELYRKEDGASYQKIATVKTGTYTDKTLTVGKKYFYKVRSVKTISNGNTIYSDDTAEKSIKTKLAITTLKAASSNYTSIKLTWKKVAGANNYELYRSTSKGGKYSKLAVISDGSTVKYTDSKLKTGQTYYYKLRACYISGKQKTYSVYSNIDSAKVVPAAPKISAVSSSNYHTLKIKWSKVSGANGYVVYRSTSEKGTYKKIATIKNAKTLNDTDTKLDTGKKYYYKIRAYRIVGKNKVYGLYSEIKAGKPVPAKAKGLKAKSVNANKIKLTWNKVSGAKSYTIYRSTSKNGQYQAIKTGCTKTTYTNTKLSNGKKYYYKVAAVRGKTVGKLSDVVTAKAVSLSVNKSSLTLQKGAKEKIKATVSPKATVKWSTSNKKIAKVSSGGTIRAVSVGNAKITLKANGVTTTVSVKVIPPAPKMSSISSVNYNTLSIKWKKASGADGYAIYRSTSKNGTYKKIATIKSAKTLNYTDKKLTTGKKYYYKVRAYQTVKKKKVWGKYSSVKAGTPIPSKVSGVKATSVDGNKIKLTWNKVSGAKSYTIYRSTSKSGTYQAIKTGCTSVSYTNSKLKNGITYYYKIAAIRGKISSKLSGYVSAKAATLSVSQSSVTMQQGMSVKITAKATPKTTVKWSTSNKNIAKVSSGGTITGVGAGSAKVYAKANGITKTITVKVKKRLNGIDVSKWQGDIDFNAVKKAGIDVVMIRVFNGYSKDPYFESNYAKAKAAGLNIGVYYYTYAKSMEQARQDAMTVLGILNGRSLQYPVTIDMEDVSLLDGLSNTDRTDILWTFCNTIKQNSNYKYGLYANLNWLNNYFENHRLIGMPIWIARYRDPSLGHGYTGAGNVFMWQYTSQGTLPGINGYVDMNYVY